MAKIKMLTKCFLLFEILTLHRSLASFLHQTAHRSPLLEHQNRKDASPFSAPPRFSITSSSSPSSLNSNRPNKNEWEDESRIRKRAEKSGDGTAGTVGGALLGGLVGGPFGALFGAQIGATFGSARAVDKARKEEMERMGITPEMLMMAEEVGRDLDMGVQGLKVTRQSLETQQSLARNLNGQMEQLYEKAKLAMQSSDDDAARDFLFEKQTMENKLMKVLGGCKEERTRITTMEKNVTLLEERALEVDVLLRRSVGAKVLGDSPSMSSLSLERDDPLLNKFRDLGID